MTRRSVPSAALPALKNSWQPTQAFQANPAVPSPDPMTQPAAAPNPERKADVQAPVPAAAGPFNTALAGYCRTNYIGPKAS